MNKFRKINNFSSFKFFKMLFNQIINSLFNGYFV